MFELHCPVGTQESSYPSLGAFCYTFSAHQSSPTCESNLA